MMDLVRSYSLSKKLLNLSKSVGLTTDELAKQLQNGENPKEALNDFLSNHNVSPRLKSKIKSFEFNDAAKQDIKTEISKLERTKRTKRQKWTALLR